MIRNAWRLSVTLSTALALGACGSTRLASLGPGPAASAPAASVPVAPEPIVPVPSDPVTSAPLAPLPGSPGPVAAIDPSVPPPGPIGSDVPRGSPSAPPPGPGPVASLPPPASPGRASVVGGWTAKDASGSSCRVQLSSSPALDLYRASASGCSNKDLSRVTAWDFREGEVYLYQPGGAVAARLRTAGGSLDGVLAKSGAPLTLSR